MDEFDFQTSELSGLLDRIALNEIARGNSDLTFGGSSEAEAEIFGREINANDTIRFGALQGGIALSNLKFQEERRERLNNIKEIQAEIRARRQQNLESQRLEETIRSNQATELIRQDANDINRLGTTSLANLRDTQAELAPFDSQTSRISANASATSASASVLNANTNAGNVQLARQQREAKVNTLIELMRQRGFSDAEALNIGRSAAALGDRALDEAIRDNLPVRGPIGSTGNAIRVPQGQVTPGQFGSRLQSNP